MQTRNKIAVAGATGRVGRHVVDILEAGGHDVVAMSAGLGFPHHAAPGAGSRLRAGRPEAARMR